ncbi:hypothetical protein QKU48_gp0803 [Fadolivirus algeromassiliense]|jgi:hypothetical protein|uniref:Uncharacterized protein n=1 Tax=Fadolivirus FV1/VV64 TaxID=3070911 RepID=A0A7D3R185_9VIRU|nr:hypothetical protein QKU48_gp0803 [Fadolivirus algeromassiliense]QKF94261.1 hypothetical protein Fadolivirus_1_803 [Fadolivirus FV1/VV64]
MGGSSSTSRVHQESNTLIMNENDVKIVNQQLNEFVAKAVIKTASSCSANINQTAKISIRNLEAKGDIDLTTANKQQAYLDFSCINVNTVRNQIANDMISQIMQSIENKSDTDVLNKLKAIADTKSEQGFGGNILPWGGSDSKSDVEQIQNYQQYTKNNTNIENIVKTAVEVGFTSESLSSCISTINQQAEYQAENLKAGGNIKLIHTNDQGSQLFTSCLNQNDVGNEVTSRIMGAFDIKTQSDTKTKVTTEMEGDATAYSKTSGLDDVIRSIGDAFGNIFGGLFAALGLGALGPLAGPSSSSSSLSSCICVCCIILIVALFGFKSFGGSSDSGQSVPGTE